MKRNKDTNSEQTRPNPFDFLYESNQYDIIESLGASYKPPKSFRHATWEVVAKLKKDPKNGDGQTVHVFECRWPARFYRLKAIAGKNSLGQRLAGFVMSSGSGRAMGEMIGALAKEITKGMIHIRYGRKE